MLNSLFFFENYETHIDFDREKIYFVGKGILDKENNSIFANLPLWAIIALSIVGLLGVVVLIWYFRKEKKRALAKGLEEYEQIEERH